MLRELAKSSASATCSSAAKARTGGNGPSRRRDCPRFSPPMKRHGHLLQRSQGTHGRQRPLAYQQLPEVLTVDEAHRDVVGALELADVVDGHDVGVMQVRADPRLLRKALDDDLVGGQRWLEDLDRDGPAQTKLLGLIDRGHAPAT